MDLHVRRECPICGGPAGSRAFPYGTRFNDLTFDYLRCRSCGSVFVDPVPDAETFAKMYSKASYHDCHYDECDSTDYEGSAKLLRDFLSPGASVLDYGCGLGLFLKALQAEGFIATGVEFDQEAADYAARNAACPAFTVANFMSQKDKPIYDALHLGDVLEHLPDPDATLRKLLAYVRPGGFMFVEGPLENNPSPVYWAARLFGAAKRRLRPNFRGSSPPTHLFRVTEAQQLALFARIGPGLSRLHWELHETGWPYASGGALKRAIACMAMALSGKRIGGSAFGNRFRGVFRLARTGQP